jgi:hypothetical protein
MSQRRTVADLLPTRRELLQFGGLGLAGAAVSSISPRVATASTASKVHPRASARNVIFYEISGAISHLETFDFKDNPGTPKDFEVRKISNGTYFPVNFLPRITPLMDRVAVMRSLVSNEEVHLRGQYYVQAGRPLNVAFAREIPSIGSVVASELEQHRRDGDTFPIYVSFNLETNAVGALATGFLPPEFSVFDLNAQQALSGMSLDGKALELIEERWRVLSGLREINRDRMSGFGRQVDAYEKFSDTAKRLLTDPRWPAAFQITAEDRKRYGNTGAGIGCALARNLLREDGGTRYIHVCHNGWDHHKDIWNRKVDNNHYKLMSEFDPALASLLEDLAASPAKLTPGKSLLDETLVVFMSEFGRTPGALNHLLGRDHHKYICPAMFAGGGVKGGVVSG